MTLSSLNLEAFAEIAKTGSFSQAAKNLHVTQSALSQRLQKLEGELEAALLIRDSNGIRLTPIGEELFRHCRIRASLEDEFLSRLGVGKSQIAGTVRVAGFSSIVRSALMPTLEPLLKKNPQLRIEIYTREIRDLSKMLASNEVDFIVTLLPAVRQDVVSVKLGVEENVLVESPHIKDDRRSVYLDHDVEDETTITFLKQNRLGVKGIQRGFLDEVYAILDAVKCGWGRAVLPRHMVNGDKSVRIVEGKAPLNMPVYLQYFNQPYYTKLHQILEAEITKNLKQYL